ncbi:MAG: hypothetical protein U0P45_14655 [Acidimicrobiales bacterium]
MRDGTGGANRRTIVVLAAVAVVAVLATGAWVLAQWERYQDERHQQRAGAAAIRAVDAEVRLALARADLPVYEHQVAVTCDEIRAAGSEPDSQGPGATMIVDGKLAAVRAALARGGMRTRSDADGTGDTVDHATAKVRRGGATVLVTATGATQYEAGGITIFVPDLDCT